MASTTVLQPVKERGWRRGFANLLRKENGEWWRTRRWWLQSLLWLLIINGILAVGLTFPVVPLGDETIRFQVNAAHTVADIDQVLGALEVLK